jgi:surfeit locus 1 family protein
MMRRMIVPLIFGVGGTLVLIWLGAWQMQRLVWKDAALADIELRIAAAPVTIPDDPDPIADRYLPVEAMGVMGSDYLRILVSQRQIGAGYRIVVPFDTGDRTILLDRGFIHTRETLPPAPVGPVTIQGNLHWPDEVTSATPAPDLGANIWFARDVPAMAEALGAVPILLIARAVTQDAGVTPLPVDTVGIPNDHLEYAITWFSLAVLWLGMTGYLLWRIRQKTI